MGAKSKRQQMRERQRRKKTISSLIWGGIGIVVLAGAGFIILKSIPPAAVGEAVPSLGANHIPLDSDPGTYNSNPPTSGQHYPQPLTAGFYDTNNYQFPQGYLIHNMEHGYVILWYNCDKLSDSACTDLKSQIKSTMDELGGTKLIAYPWTSIDTPLAMTSWGRLQKLESFDRQNVTAFYRANLNRAPEPDAP